MSANRQSGEAGQRAQKSVLSRARHDRPSLSPSRNYNAIKNVWHSYYQRRNLPLRMDSLQSQSSSGDTAMSLKPYCDATSSPRKTFVEVFLGTTDKILESTVRMKRASTSEHVDAPDRSRPRHDVDGVTRLFHGVLGFRTANSQIAASVAGSPADFQFTGSQFDLNVAPGADLSLGEPVEPTKSSAHPGPGVLLPLDNVQSSQQSPTGSSSVPPETPGNISVEAPRPRSLAKSIYHDKRRWSNSTATFSVPPSDVFTLRTDSNDWSESDICDSPRMTTFSQSVTLKAEKGGSAMPRLVPNHPESRIPRSSPLSRRSHDQTPETVPLGQNFELARVLVTATSGCAFMPAHFMGPVPDTLHCYEGPGSWTEDPARTTLQEASDSGIPVHGDIDLGPSSLFSSQFGNESEELLVIRRKSSGLDLQHGMESSCVISPQAPDASDLPELSTHFEPNIKLKSLTTENLLATGRPISRLSTIGEGGSDMGGSSGEASPIDPCQAGSAIDGHLCPRRSTPSWASQSDMDNIGAPGSVSTREADPRTPATSVPDAAMDSDLEDEDDEDLSSETTDATNEAFLDAFEASSLDSDLLPLVWSMKEQIKEHALASIRAWITSATDDLTGSPMDSPGGGSCAAGGPSNTGLSFGKYGSAGGPSGGPGAKRPYAEDDNYGQGSGSGDGSGNGPEKRTKIEDNTPRFACPFPKRYPEMVWPGNCKTGWPSVRRLKGHIYTNHMQRLHCSRCFAKFTSEAKLNSHSRSNPPCVVDENPKPLIGIDRDMKKKLTSRKEIQHWTEERLWNRMWMIIFPDDPIPSPYCPLSYIKDPEHFQKEFRRAFTGTLLDEVANELDDRYVVYFGNAVVSPSDFGRKIQKCVHEAMEKVGSQEVQRQPAVPPQPDSRIAHLSVVDDSMHISVPGSSQPVTSSFAPTTANASLTPNDDMNEIGSAGFEYSSIMDNDPSLGDPTFEEEEFGLRQVQQWNEEDKGKGVDFSNGMI